MIVQLAWVCVDPCMSAIQANVLTPQMLWHYSCHYICWKTKVMKYWQTQLWSWLNNVVMKYVNIYKNNINFFSNKVRNLLYNICLEVFTKFGKKVYIIYFDLISFFFYQKIFLNLIPRDSPPYASPWDYIFQNFEEKLETDPNLCTLKRKRCEIEN